VYIYIILLYTVMIATEHVSTLTEAYFVEIVILPDRFENLFSRSSKIHITYDIIYIIQTYVRNIRPGRVFSMGIRKDVK
jgi:hypothetical protein